MNNQRLAYKSIVEDIAIANKKDNKLVRNIKDEATSKDVLNDEANSLICLVKNSKRNEIYNDTVFDYDELISMTNKDLNDLVEKYKTLKKCIYIIYEDRYYYDIISKKLQMKLKRKGRSIRVEGIY